MVQQDKRSYIFFYSGGLLNGTNIRMDKIDVFLEFVQYYHYWSSDYWFFHHM